MNDKEKILNLFESGPLPIIDEQERINEVQKHIQGALEAAGFDFKDPNLKNTPKRVAKMWIQELFVGCNEQNKPSFTLYPYEGPAGQVIQIRNIRVQSCCAHHLLPFTGSAELAYIPNRRLIGLSKINRIIDYYGRRPQLQERLCAQIITELKEVLDTEDIALRMQCLHMCMSLRGVRDENALTITELAFGRLQDRAHILFSDKGMEGV